MRPRDDREVCAQEAYRVFAMRLGRGRPWHELDHDEQYAWMEAIDRAILAAAKGGEIRHFA